MSRIALGLTAVLVSALTACGTNPGTIPQAPATTPPSTDLASPSASATPAATPTLVETAAPTAVASATAMPSATAATATAGATATASAGASAGPGGAAPAELPARLESFNRVEQRSENDTRIGTYYSDDLKTVIEVRTTRGRTARDLITTLGGTEPIAVGEAVCSTRGDTLCARERNGVTAVVAAKELPATMVATLVTKALEGR